MQLPSQPAHLETCTHVSGLALTVSSCSCSFVVGGLGSFSLAARSLCRSTFLSMSRTSCDSRACSSALYPYLHMHEVTPGLGKTAFCGPARQSTGCMCENEIVRVRACTGAGSDNKMGTPQPVLLRKLLVGFQQRVKLQVIFVQLIFTSTCTDLKLSTMGAKDGP